MSSRPHHYESHHAAAPHKLKRAMLLIVVPMAACLVSLIVYLQGGRYVETDSAYIKAQKVPVSASVAGAVKEVLVQENQKWNFMTSTQRKG